MCSWSTPKRPTRNTLISLRAMLESIVLRLTPKILAAMSRIKPVEPRRLPDRGNC